MISRDCRPATFDEVAGNQLNITVLKEIIKNPENSPRCLMFAGAFGCGKTTLARLFAKALNCTGKEMICGSCSNCLKDLDSSSFYTELDSSVVGSVDEIRNMRDTFTYLTTGGYRVIVFDEIHLASKQAQSALLKVLEDNNSNVFFILATTNPEKVLPTIKSRSLNLTFTTIEMSEIKKNLILVSKRLGLSPSEQVLDIISRRSRGHMRNAHMLLDLYNLLGEDKFLSSVHDLQDVILDYFKALAIRDIQLLYSSVDSIMKFPLEEVVVDFQEVVYQLIKVLISKKGSSDKVEVLKRMGNNALKIIKLCISPTVIESFKTDYQLQTVLLAVYQMTEPTQPVQKHSSSSLRDRAVVK